MNKKKKKIKLYHILGKIRSIGRRPFPKAKNVHFMFKVVFQNLLEWRHVNEDSFKSVVKIYFVLYFTTLSLYLSGVPFSQSDVGLTEVNSPGKLMKHHVVVERKSK